jgi:hypothetical protein
MQVVVAPSTLGRNAGMGLFAACDIKPLELVCEYTGKVLSFAQAKQVKNRMYMKMVALDYHIDASDASVSSVARYINDHWDPSFINTEFVTREDKKVFVRAIRNIGKGEELFVSYGRGHWLFCVDEGLAEAFLGLRGGEGTFTTKSLKARESVCVYSCSLWGTTPDTYYGPRLGVRCARQAGTGSNCKLTRNPFLPGTHMLVSTREIDSNEELVLETSLSNGRRTMVVLVTHNVMFKLGVNSRSSVLACVAMLGDDASLARLSELVTCLADKRTSPTFVVWVHLSHASCGEGPPQLVGEAHNFTPQGQHMSVRKHDKLGNVHRPGLLDLRSLAFSSSLGFVDENTDMWDDNAAFYKSLEHAKRSPQHVHGDSLWVRGVAVEAGGVNKLIELIVRQGWF